jgi:hypothetical protein
MHYSGLINVGNGPILRMLHNIAGYRIGCIELLDAPSGRTSANVGNHPFVLCLCFVGAEGKLSAREDG